MRPCLKLPRDFFEWMKPEHSVVLASICRDIEGVDADDDVAHSSEDEFWLSDSLSLL
jgi:hypothetical protein